MARPDMRTIAEIFLCLAVFCAIACGNGQPGPTPDIDAPVEAAIRSALGVEPSMEPTPPSTSLVTRSAKQQEPTTTPSPNPLQTATLAPLPKDTPMPALLPAATPTFIPSPTAMPTPALLPAATPTFIPSPTAMPTPALLPAAMPTFTLLPTATPTPVLLPAATPTLTPLPRATRPPAPEPTPTSSLTAEIAWDRFESVYIQRIAKIDTELAEKAARLSWVAKGLTGKEWIPLSLVHHIAEGDVTTALILLDYPWMADDLTTLELQTLISLVGIARKDPELARWAVSQPFMDPRFGDRDSFAMEALALMAIERPQRNVVTLLKQQPWFSDGLDDDETVLLTVMRSEAYIDGSTVGTDRVPRDRVEVCSASIVRQC